MALLRYVSGLLLLALPLLLFQLVLLQFCYIVSLLSSLFPWFPPAPPFPAATTVLLHRIATIFSFPFFFFFFFCLSHITTYRVPKRREDQILLALLCLLSPIRSEHSQQRTNWLYFYLVNTTMHFNPADWDLWWLGFMERMQSS